MMGCCIEDMLPSGKVVRVVSQRADVFEGRSCGGGYCVFPWGWFLGSAEGDGEESRYGEGARDLSSADWDRGAGVCEYSGGEAVGSIYVRGKIKVNIQWMLYCMVHNMGKIMSYGFA